MFQSAVGSVSLFMKSRIKRLLSSHFPMYIKGNMVRIEVIFSPRRRRPTPAPRARRRPAEVNSDLIELSDSQRTALALYHNTFSDERVDHDLIVHVIKKVQETEEDRGAVLVFLPGYEDIVTLR